MRAMSFPSLILKLTGQRFLTHTLTRQHPDP